MKKTVSVNIKGSNFLIEEDAYELLQDYLDRLSKALKNESGSKEIIEDVELRIAELCSEKLSEFKKVVELEDIQDILDTLGDPSMYLDDESEESQESFDEKSYEKSAGKSSDRRLFRDTDNAVIGGVCQGIANFMNIDVVIIRAVFVVILFFAGFGFPLYLILWIIVPKTKSTIDRLRMKGRPITVESVREEVENAADRIKDKSGSFAASFRDNGEKKQRFAKVGRIVAIIAGIVFICWGLSWLVMVLIFIIGGSHIIPLVSEDGLVSITEFAELVLASPGDIAMAWVGALLFGFSVILFLLLLGSSLIFKLRNKWMKLTLIGLFAGAIIGGIMCAYVGVKASVDITLKGEIEPEDVVTIDADQLILLPELSDAVTKNGFKVKSNGRNGFMKITDNEIRMYGIEILYRESTDSLFHISQNFSARGKGNSKAVQRAVNIDHSMRLQGDSLYLDTDYSFPREDKIRDQHVLVIIDIPEGSSVLADGREIFFSEIDEENEDQNDRRTRRKRSYGRFYGDGDYENRGRHY